MDAVKTRQLDRRMVSMYVAVAGGGDCRRNNHTAASRLYSSSGPASDSVRKQTWYSSLLAVSKFSTFFLQSTQLPGMVVPGALPITHG